MQNFKKKLIEKASEYADKASEYADKAKDAAAAALERHRAATAAAAARGEGGIVDDFGDAHGMQLDSDDEKVHHENEAAPPEGVKDDLFGDEPPQDVSAVAPQMAKTPAVTSTATAHAETPSTSARSPVVMTGGNGGAVGGGSIWNMLPAEQTKKSTSTPRTPIADQSPPRRVSQEAAHQPPPAPQVAPAPAAPASPQATAPAPAKDLFDMDGFANSTSATNPVPASSSSSSFNAQPAASHSTESLGRKDSFSAFFGGPKAAPPVVDPLTKLQTLSAKPAATTATKPAVSPRPQAQTAKPPPASSDPLASLLNFGSAKPPPAKPVSQAAPTASHTAPVTAPAPSKPNSQGPSPTAGSNAGAFDFLRSTPASTPTVMPFPAPSSAPHPQVSSQSAAPADDFFSFVSKPTQSSVAKPAAAPASQPVSSNNRRMSDLFPDFGPSSSSKPASTPTTQPVAAPQSAPTAKKAASPSPSTSSTADDDILSFVTSSKPKPAPAAPVPARPVQQQKMGDDLLAFASGPAKPAAPKPAGGGGTVTPFKEQGNELYKIGKIEDAIAAYTRGIETGGSDSAQASDISACYVNRAMCHCQHADWLAVVEDCTAALALNPTYTKALLRRAMAYEGLEKYKKAMEDYQRAMEVEPGTKLASEGLGRCKNIVAQM